MKRNIGRVVIVLLCLVLAILPVMAQASGATVRIYCDTPDDWSVCYVYWWGGTDEGPTWPGAAMEQGEDDVWFYDVPAGAVNLMFNDGNNQSPTLTMPTDGYVLYDYAANAWVIPECKNGFHPYDNGICTVCDHYQEAAGGGTAAEPYEISNAGQLYWFAEQVNAGNVDICGVLTADIVINKQVLTADGALNGDVTNFRQWVPIGNADIAYSGTFDGNGKTISGIFFPDSSVDYAGFYGYISSDGMVKNVGILDSYVDGRFGVGGAVGYNKGTVENCYNAGAIGSDCYEASFGGVVGGNSGTVENCYNTGAVSGFGDTGGVVGRNAGTMDNCYNNGVVSGSGYGSTGGVVGNNYGVVGNCYNTGTISRDGEICAYTGGVVGENAGTVRSCYNTGAVSGSSIYSSGSYDSSGYTGGVVGSNGGTVENCYNTGTIIHYGGICAYTGGVVGENAGTVRSCYNTGAVSSFSIGSSSYTGGVVGSNSGTMENCYNIGTVRCDYNYCPGGITGGMVASNASNGTVTNCYYNSQAFNGPPFGANTGTATNVEGRSTAQFESGEVAYLLNGDQSEIVFKQTIGTDANPNFTGETVYRTTNSVGAVIYTNTNDGCLAHIEKVITGRAPGCTETGLTDGVVCAVCGETLTAQEEIPAKGHSYEDGICAVCGAADPSVPIVVIPTLTLDHPSLSFEGEIMYNLYFSADDLTSVVEMGLIAFNTKNTEGTIENAENVYPGYITAGTLYMGQSEGVPARYLGDAVYFKAYAKLTDGSYVYSGMAGYNAVVYAKSILKNSTNDYMKRLVVAMINYGAEAQAYFNARDGITEYEPMNDFLTLGQLKLIQPYDASMVAELTAVDPNKVGMFTYNTGDFAKRTNSVSFDGAFAINYYFTAKGTPDNGMKLYYWNTADYEAADVLTPENATGSMDMIEGMGNQYWGVISDIAAKQVNETFFVAGVYELDGVTYTTGVLAYSLGKYCAKLAAGTTDQQALSAATAVYGYYAKEYFANA